MPMRAAEPQMDRYGRDTTRMSAAEMFLAQARGDFGPQSNPDLIATQKERQRRAMQARADQLAGKGFFGVGAGVGGGMGGGVDPAALRASPEGVMRGSPEGMMRGSPDALLQHSPLLGLGLVPSLVVIPIFAAFCCLFPALISVWGPRTGMRQLVLCRYSWGYYPVAVIVVLGTAGQIGYCILNVSGSPALQL